ncbi:MAG: hypothetical protein FVQ79_09450 [Planctomycetes bacterium]|nr:hypothetical protein [Planctomycetota bacterium]
MKKRMTQLSLAACLVIASSVICLAFIKNEPAAEDERECTLIVGKTDVPAGMVALEIDLPPFVFEGTRKNLEGIENLEEPRAKGQTRPTMLVPAGTMNVALGKTVTSTSYTPIVGVLADITDGEKFGDGYVELDPFEQSITIDLGASYEIYAIALWHYHKYKCVYFDMVVQTADDPDFIMNVNTLFNNDIDNTHGLGIGKDKNYVESYEGKLIDAKGTAARYVRFHSNTNTLNDFNHYIEVEVYGKQGGQ